MQLLLYRRIFHVPVKLRLLRNADAGHLLEEPARSFIQAHGSFPSGGFVDGCSEMRDGVIQARRRPMAAGALRDYGESARNFLCGENSYVLRFSVFFRNIAAFIQRVFTSDFVPVLFNEEIDTKLAGAFFA